LRKRRCVRSFPQSPTNQPAGPYGRVGTSRLPWRFPARGRPFTTQGPALALNEVGPENAGDYQVVVTGPGGSVTSSVATLIVATSPLIYGTVLNSDGSVTLSFVSQPDSTDVVLCATNLGPPIA